MLFQTGEVMLSVEAQRCTLGGYHASPYLTPAQARWKSERAVSASVCDRKWCWGLGNCTPEITLSYFSLPHHAQLTS